jgi:hypothetical protein
MGYTHHDKISAVNGIAIGAKDSEREVVSSAAAITGASIKVGASGSEVGVPLSVSIAVPITAANTTNYVAAPIAGAITGYVSWGVSTGTVHSVLVRAGSAGTTLASTGTIGVVALIGHVTPLGVSSPNTCGAGDSLSVFMGSCATAQALNMCVLTFTPTV